MILQRGWRHSKLERVAAKAQGLGFRAERIIGKNGIPTNNVKIFGSHAANELLGLSKSARRVAVNNTALLKAKEFNTSARSKFNVTKLGGALTVGAGILIGVAVSAAYDALFGGFVTEQITEIARDGAGG